MRFRYLDWGSPGNRPILFLHGGGLTSHTWDLVCLALREDYHCLALDQRGHGDSEWSPEMDYSLDAHRGDLEAFVDRLGLEGLVLVGMSMGGANAMAYAGRPGARVSALVLVDVGPEVRLEGARRIRQFTMAVTEFESVEHVVEQALAFNPRRDPRLLRRREALWAAVPEIVCPTLVVRGGQSDVFLDEDAEKLARSLRQGEWVRVEGAGHTVQGDNPGDLVAAIRRFLERRPAR